LIFFSQNFSITIYSQTSLKDIVLTYDLNRVADPGNMGRYPIDRAQVVHMEPICENPEVNGSYCAIMLDLERNGNTFDGELKLVHKDPTTKYFYIDSAFICDSSTCSNAIFDTSDCDFVLKVYLTTSPTNDSVPIDIRTSNFKGNLSGKRMDVSVDAIGSICPLRQNVVELSKLKPMISPPWVCRFVLK
ncbi:MAG: hypothetical protein KDC53_13990, partial [Saprospiraceae bacterium]|nr:hypothetical protein [Saprospiraceae bacterium]